MAASPRHFTTWTLRTLMSCHEVLAVGFVNDALKAIRNPFSKDDHDLIVLRITLTLADGKPQVVFDLTVTAEIRGAGRAELASCACRDRHLRAET